MPINLEEVLTGIVFHENNILYIISSPIEFVLLGLFHRVAPFKFLFSNGLPFGTGRDLLGVKRKA